MNIDDVTIDSKIPEQVFPHIFQHQYDLEMKYLEIEHKNGFYFPDFSKPSPHIDDAQYQHWLKSMFWRVTEEIAEACEVIPDLSGDWQTRWETDTDLRHFFEELADALHFLVAASIPIEINPGVLDKAWEKFSMESTDRNNMLVKAMCFNVIALLGLCGNTLKNKPWKVTQMTTDHQKLFKLMNMTWVSFFELMTFLGCSKETLYQLYMKKNAVNSFRRSTSY